MKVKRNWNAVAARAAEYLARNPGANKEALYSYIRMIADGCSLSNCALACAHLGPALVARRSPKGTTLQHWINGCVLPAAVADELFTEAITLVISARAPDA